MAFPPSLLRVAEHTAMRNVTLHGSVIDLGGSEDAGYRSIFKGTYTTTSANLEGHQTAAIHCNLEDPLPIPDKTYDGVLLINTLEHIYHAHELVRESARIAKKDASIVIVVPFLFPVHPSPSDYWRFTGDTLSRMLTEAGFTEVAITPLAYGVFTTRFVNLERVMPGPVRVVLFYLCAPVANLLDHTFAFCTKMLGMRYDPKEYPSGYMAVGKRI
jgi:SAM-dependent methyltransferase